MRRFPGSWTTTLISLGFKRKPRSKAAKRGRQLRSESLEPRQMLSGTPADPQPVRPEYVLTGWGEDDSPEAFVVSTEYDEGGKATAVVSLAEDYNGTLEGSLQELQLELKIGEITLQTQEVAISVADPDFVAEFLDARRENATDDVEAADTSSLPSLLSLIDENGEFVDLAQQPSQLDESINRLTQIAATLAASSDASTALTSSQRIDLYAAQGWASAEAEVARFTAADETEVAAAERRIGRVQELGLLLTPLLVEDVSQADVSADAARAAIDKILASSDLYYTLFAGYGRNQDVIRIDGDAQAHTFVIGAAEESTYAPHDQLRVELDGLLAMVQVFAVDGNALDFQVAAQSFFRFDPAQSKTRVC